MAEPMMKCAGYILGEFGHMLQGVPAPALFNLLHPHFLTASADAKSLLLSSYAKMLTHAPAEEALFAKVQKVFQKYQVPPPPCPLLAPSVPPRCPLHAGSPAVLGAAPARG